MGLRHALRQQRRAAGLTQAELAELLHTSQSWVARVETGKIDPGLGSVEKYLAAVGGELRVQLYFTPLSAAGVAVRARRDPGNEELFLRLCLELIKGFDESGPEAQAQVLNPCPPPTGSHRWDAYLAALAEHLAYHNGLPIPDWVEKEGRFLRRWWFPTDLPSVRQAALVESPAAFRRRGIFVTADLFSHP